MNRKYCDILFFLTCFCLVFNNIPQALQMNFLGGLVGNKLVFYPLILSVFYSLWCEFRYNEVLVQKNVIVKFLKIYFGIFFLSLVIGLITYPYFNDVINGPINQVEKLPGVLQILHSKGVNIDAELLLLMWMIARMTKNFLIEIVYTFIAAYFFFCWYKNRWSNAFGILVKAILCSIFIIFLYSFSLEIPYLLGNETCTKIMRTITPFIHTVNDDGKWWPPLVWPGQLRSIFAEPSYFGIYTAFAMPYLWYLVYKDRKIIGMILIFLMTFLLFLTKARTGFVLLIGEVVLLMMVFFFFERKRDFFNKTGLIVLCTLLAFVSSNLFMSAFMDKRSKDNEVDVTTAMTEYIDSNATSLANPDKRSNRARYSIMEADIRIGLDHPFLGVGRGLRNGYIPHYLPEKGKQNEEVKMWLSYREKMGVLKSGFPTLGEYTVRFGETGIIGIIAFLAPVFFLIVKMIKKLMDNSFRYKIEYGMFLISLLGIMASGIGDTLYITYCYWVLLGLGYAMCFGKNEGLRLN